jgi:hypothetical protein
MYKTYNLPEVLFMGNNNILDHGPIFFSFLAKPYLVKCPALPYFSSRLRAHSFLGQYIMWILNKVSKPAI